MIDFLKKAAAYCGACITVLFVCKGGIGTPFAWNLFAYLAVVILVTCVVLAWVEVFHGDRELFRRRRSSAEMGSLVLALKRGHGSVVFAARSSEEIALQANRIVRKGLDKNCIKYPDYKKWRRKNPSIFSAVLDDRKELVGFFDIFPLTEQAALGLQNGTLAERELTIDCILPAAENCSAKFIYIASVMVNPKQTAFSDMIARDLVLIKLGEYLMTEFPPDGTRHLMAYAHTREGEVLLKNWEFRNLLIRQDCRQHDPFYLLGPKEYEELATSITHLPSSAIPRIKRRRSAPSRASSPSPNPQVTA